MRDYEFGNTTVRYLINEKKGFDAFDSARYD